MPEPRRPSNTEHPAALGSFRSWTQLLRAARGIDRAYVLRALFVSATTALTSPLRLWERARYGRTIRNTAIHPSPVFIIGHWRSGTTHLHHLMCQDDAFGYVSTFQALAPGFSLVGDRAVKPLLARQARSRYPTRLIDNIPLLFDAPQEDEFALANLSPYAFVHTFTLPRQAEDIFERSVLFQGLAPIARSRWVDSYLTVLRMATLASGGRRLVLKNCAHTARIPTLLELFPDAKFVHIHRDPYEVFLSTLHMHRTVLQRSQLQSIGPGEIEAHVLRFYELLMRRFLADRSRIPAEHLVEVRFADLETSPLKQLREVYEQLDLPGFDAAKPAFRSHLGAVAGYRKNAYNLDPSAIAKVNDRWGFAFEPWGYDRLEPTDGSAGTSVSVPS